MLGLALEEPEEGETRFEIDGINFAVAEWAKAYAEGAVIDYVREVGREGFTVTADKKWYEVCEDEEW